jgi:hypothetical protein
MITVSDIQASWSDALKAIQQLRPDAVIGGGCLRDLDNGREVKDVDIFVFGTRDDHLVDLHVELTNTGYEVASIDPGNWYPVGDGNDVVGFFEMPWGGGPPLQIIMVNHPTANIVDRFDFGICKIAYDGAQLIVDEHYKQDKAVKEFRLRRSRTNDELAASVHRYARPARKYEGWRFFPFAESTLEDFPL